MRLVFCGWFLLTVIHQFTKGRNLTSRVDPFMMYLPLWTFFGPIPGTTDSEIAFRFADELGNHSEWRHLDLYEPRTITHLIIHRNRRLEKTVFDAVAQIQRLMSSDVAGDRISASPPYIVLLSVVLATAPLPDEARKVQFMIVQSSGVDQNVLDAVPIFASAFHTVPQKELAKQ